MSGTSAHWKLIQKLFEQALGLPIDQRQVFLESLTAPQVVIEEVGAMLVAHEGEPLALESSVDLLIDKNTVPERLGPYLITKELGQGGMSIVYLGVRDDNTFNRQVAIKTLNTVTSTNEIHERFRQEQRIHAGLNHPHIARLLDAGVSPNGKPFLVMQYVDGMSIIDYANSQNCDIEMRLKLIVQVCEAISFAHSRLVLHRDIKPSNIWVDKKGQVVLLDFGIAKLLTDSNDADRQQLTSEGEKLMTLSYASPEQIRGEELGTASDVYSLGVVFYELISGHRPFTAEGNYALSEAIINQPAVAPLTMGGGQKIPRDLQAISVKALEKRAQDRYASVAGFSADIRRYLNHEVISARPPSLSQRLTKFWRRNPVAFPLGSIAIIGIFISLAVALWQTNQAEQQRTIATSQRDRAEQVVTLLLDLFDSDPYADNESRRDDVTLREFLTSRAENMEVQLKNQPELQAKLFGLFANLHANLGQLELAEPMAVKALVMQRELHGDMNLEVARSANTLGTLRQYQARFDEAESLFREALAIRSELLTEDHPDYANSINNLSTLFYERGRPEDRDEMIALDELALTIREKYFGKGSLQVAESLNNIASAKIQRNLAKDWDAAEAMFRRALTIRQDKLGDAHANTGNTMSNLANLLLNMGQLVEAEQLFLQSIVVTEAALGKNHSRVSAPLFGLGQLYQQQSKWDEAQRVFLRSLEINQASLPVNHPYIIDDLTELVTINLNRKDLKATQKFLSEIQFLNIDDSVAEKNIKALQLQLEELQTQQ